MGSDKTNGLGRGFLRKEQPRHGFFLFGPGSPELLQLHSSRTKGLFLLWENSCCPTILAPFPWQHQRWSIAVSAVLPASLPCVCMAEIPGGRDRFALKHSIVLLLTPTALSKILPHNYSFSVSLHLNKVLLSGSSFAVVSNTPNSRPGKQMLNRSLSSQEGNRTLASRSHIHVY